MASVIRKLQKQVHGGQEGDRCDGGKCKIRSSVCLFLQHLKTNLSSSPFQPAFSDCRERHTDDRILQLPPCSPTAPIPLWSTIRFFIFTLSAETSKPQVSSRHTENYFLYVSCSHQNTGVMSHAERCRIMRYVCIFPHSSAMEHIQN